VKVASLHQGARRSRAGEYHWLGSVRSEMVVRSCCCCAAAAIVGLLLLCHSCCSSLIEDQLLEAVLSRCCSCLVEALLLEGVLRHAPQRQRDLLQHVLQLLQVPNEAPLLDAMLQPLKSVLPPAPAVMQQRCSA
jgi:hypothetical protein